MHKVGRLLTMTPASNDPTHVSPTKLNAACAFVPTWPSTLMDMRQMIISTGVKQA